MKLVKRNQPLSFEDIVDQEIMHSFENDRPTSRKDICDLESTHLKEYCRPASREIFVVPETTPQEIHVVPRYGAIIAFSVVFIAIIIGLFAAVVFLAIIAAANQGIPRTERRLSSVDWRERSETAADGIEWYIGEAVDGVELVVWKNHDAATVVIRGSGVSGGAITMTPSEAEGIAEVLLEQNAIEAMPSRDRKHAKWLAEQNARDTVVGKYEVTFGHGRVDVFRRDLPSSRFSLDSKYAEWFARFLNLAVDVSKPMHQQVGQGLR